LVLLRLAAWATGTAQEHKRCTAFTAAAVLVLYRFWKVKCWLHVAVMMLCCVTCTAARGKKIEHRQARRDAAPS
jgi:hypothetical protein